MEEKKLLNEEELRKIAGGDAVDRFFLRFTTALVMHLPL